MTKINKKGFTLSEALITLSVIGTLALLVLPGIIKDTTNKASIALLQGTVQIMNEAVQNEIMRTRATNIKDTNIHNNPQKFFESLDSIKTSGSGQLNFKPANGYKTLDGTATSRGSGNVAASVILRNGAGVGIQSCSGDTDSCLVAIDINGNKEPNIVGVDYFELELVGKTDNKNHKHFGDLGAYPNSGSASSVKSSCKNGNPMDCYYLLETSGFNHNYLN